MRFGAPASPRPVTAKLRIHAHSALCLALLAASVAQAADQTVRGERLVLRNPDSADSTRRTVIAVAKEATSPQRIVGDPSAQGALLEIVANGAHHSAQIIQLPQDTARNGKPLWSRLGPRGYRYRDRAAAHGPVRYVSIRQGGDGTFAIRVKLRAGRWPVDIVPPDSGTDGFITLTLADGDRYCVQFGAEGRATNRRERFWSMTQVTAEGCPPPAPVAGDLLALTYNVAGLPDWLSGSRPARNTPLISRLLNGYDLVLLQESWQTPDANPFWRPRLYHEVLAADARHPYKSSAAPLPLWRDPRRWQALVSDGLNQFSAFAFANLTRQMWNGCHNSRADCLALKGFTVSRMTLARGVTVDVYNLHMEAGGDIRDDWLHHEAVTELATSIDRYSAGRAVIVGGDFNMRETRMPDWAILRRLRDLTGLRDACATVACPEVRIDKFLYRSGAALTLTPMAWSNEGRVFVDRDGVPLSDHDPVAVRFGWHVGRQVVPGQQLWGG